MNNKIDKILTEISAGELFDKITILEIKRAKISNKEISSFIYSSIRNIILICVYIKKNLLL